MYTYGYVHTHTYMLKFIPEPAPSNQGLEVFGAEAADILWLLGGIQSARSPVIGHGTESTSSAMAWGSSLRIQAGAAEAQEAC